MSANDIPWPSHKAAMIISHNDHLSYYETIEEWTERGGAEGGDWVSEAERARSIATGELWEIQWYPETPVGFCRVRASSLQACLDAANAP